MRRPPRMPDRPPVEVLPTVEGPELRRWLSYLESLHPREIELGLERLRPVLERLDLTDPPFRVLTVAGTNGKGTSVAVAQAILGAAGHCTGAYTSPHLLHFGERIRVDGRPASEAAIVEALARVEASRESIPLTYFEFTTLAALDLFRSAGVSHAVLEVGLGGRLDAVNAIDADVALITRIARDHVQWLGTDIDDIAREKAGVVRPGRPAVIASREAPPALLEETERLGARPRVLGRDYEWQGTPGESWSIAGVGPVRLSDLPGASPWSRPWQRDNLAGAVAAVACLAPESLDPPERVAAALSLVDLPGRLQQLDTEPPTLLDVAHNPDAARALADWLVAHPVSGSTRAVFAARADKDVSGVVSALDDFVDEWWLADLSSEGGMAASQLGTKLDPGRQVLEIHEGRPGETWQAALAVSGESDRVLVLGSFLTVADVLRLHSGSRHTDSDRTGHRA